MRPPNEVRKPRPGGGTRLAANDPTNTKSNAWTAYNRFLDALRIHGSRYREGAGQTMAQCPAHKDREASLAIYRKPGRIKIKCFAGCYDALDILPKLGLTLPDLWDEPTSGKSNRSSQPDPAIQARTEARRNMTLSQRALDDLLRLPDIGTRLVMGCAYMRPELYLADKYELDTSSNAAILADPCHRHVAHLLGGADQ